jgi:hypothetical protein
MPFEGMNMRTTRYETVVFVGLGLAMVACSSTSDRADAEGDGIGDSAGSTAATEASDGADGVDGADGADGAGTTGGTTSASGPSDGGGADSPVVFDLGAIPDAGDGFGTCVPGGHGGDGEREPEFSFLWAANSTQGTISKIDTQTVTEVGRYYVRPDSSGSPSRTSVSLSGHVAVASRSGGITKFWATEEFCEESNGMPGIQTSTGNTPLAWTMEECRAWHIPFGYDSQRPVAWAPGEWNAKTCRWENELLWTAGRNGLNQDEVVLIDGDAGMVIDTVTIPGLKSDQFGIYGAAVDSEGNFWGAGWADGNNLVRVRLEDMSVTVWPGPSSTGTSSHWYGMTVDVNGYVWNCASRVARFDPSTEMWTVSPELGSWAAGCMADGDPDGLLWLGGSGVRGIDRDTFALVHSYPTPTSYGVSIDFFGYVWAVNGNGAHRVDPETGDVTSYTGLVGAYTYSDMTGYALNIVGGGAPSG